MPQLTLSERINPIIPISHLEKQPLKKRALNGLPIQQNPFPRGPVRVPLKRIGENLKPVISSLDSVST